MAIQHGAAFTQLSVESLVDCSSVAKLLDALAQVCFEKAGHIEANWQDAKTAKGWHKAGDLVAMIASKIEV